LMNLIMFAWHERFQDGVETTPSSCSRWPHLPWPLIQAAAGLILVVILGCWYHRDPDPAIVLLALIGTCQYLPMIGPTRRWRYGDRYRLLGDVAFILAAGRGWWPGG
jgi:hypothetical protein